MTAVPDVDPRVSVHNLVVRYGSRVAVDGLTLTAAAGEVVALLGPNGAGKTSTLEVLEGYRLAASGSVSVLGCDPRRDRRRLAAEVGVMLQSGGVYPAMDAEHALRLFASYYESPRDVDELITTLALGEATRTPWRRLSGGEQRRLALALALVGNPTVAFLDEPTSGVDLAGRLAIREVIRDLRNAQACVILATHELDEADRVADRVVIVDHGHVVASGSPAELKDRYRASSLEDVFLGATQVPK